MARTITDQEIALIKAMIARRIKNTDIQFFFNRPERLVNSGRISSISAGTYSNSATIPAATDEELNLFLAERSPSTEVPGVGIDPTVHETNPISRTALVAMCARDDEGEWRLTEGETDTAECKQSFSLRNAAAWLCAVAALANNRGGYIFFGIADKDVSGVWKLVGLGSDDFVKADVGEIATQLRSAFDPTPRFQKTTVDIGGKTIGVLHVERHPSRPVIATKNDGGGGEIKEGDIFYRYPGMSRRISYADLRVILDERDSKTRENILPMIRRLLELGPQHAMVADLTDGLLTDGQTSIQMSEDIIDRLTRVKEGEFHDQKMGPALRLIGDIKSAAQITIKKGSVTRDDLRRDFLNDTLHADPTDYLRTAVDMQAKEWIPMRYFADRAGMRAEDLRTFIKTAKGTAGRKACLLERLGLPDKAYVKASGPAAQIQRQLLEGERVEPTDANEARTVSLAVTGLARPLGIDAKKLRTLLLLCLDLTGDEISAIGRSEVRKAIARLDELLSTEW